jgi:prepilin-type N-terminal cleavage/methylation domain-containing protein
MKSIYEDRRLWRVDGFSLIEISIALLIIGIMAGAVLKGRSLIMVAQAESVKNDILDLRAGFSMYKSTYGVLPGDDSHAQTRFGNGVENGDGDGRISENDAKNIIAHIGKAGLIKHPFGVPKIGGQYSVLLDGNVPKIMISNDGAACLSKEQAIAVTSKITEAIGSDVVEISPKITDADGDTKYSVKVRLE